MLSLKFVRVFFTISGNIVHNLSDNLPNFLIFNTFSSVPCNVKIMLKSVEPFSIPIDILKMLKAYVSKPLEIVFNASFSTGVVPSDFKIANIVPMFKKGSQSSLCNYRPISLISVFSQLLEKLVCNRLIKFLEKKQSLI